MYCFIVFHIPIHLLRIHFRIGGDKKQRFSIFFFNLPKSDHLLVRKLINNKKGLINKVKSVSLLYFTRFTDIMILKLSADHE